MLFIYSLRTIDQVYSSIVETLTVYLYTYVMIQYSGIQESVLFYSLCQDKVLV